MSEQLPPTSTATTTPETAASTTVGEVKGAGNPILKPLWDKLEAIKPWWKRNAWWMTILAFIVGGAGLILLSLATPYEHGLYHQTSTMAKLLKVSPENFGGFLRVAGAAALSSGVFSAVLKAGQFSELFKRDLSEVVYDEKFFNRISEVSRQSLADAISDRKFAEQVSRETKDKLIRAFYEPEFLGRRSDLLEIWENVSAVLFERKFKSIAEEIKTTILKDYLPEDVNFYYHGFTQDITIEHVEGKPTHVVATEILKFNVIPASSSEAVIVPYQTTIKRSPGDAETSYEVISFQVNGVDRTEEMKRLEDRSKTTEAKLHVKFLIPLNERKAEYKIHLEHKKTLNPAIDNSKVFTYSKFVKDFYLIVRYPRELSMSFVELGTPREFKDDASSTVGRRIYKHYEGLIFPGQGYRIDVSSNPGQ